MEIKTLEWKNDTLVLIDCRKLPVKEEYVTCADYRELIAAIKCLAVRGAPAIGVSAGYGAVLIIDEAIKTKADFYPFVYGALDELEKARPTAVNLRWAVQRMRNKIKSLSSLKPEEIRENVLREANTMYDEDLECNKAIGRYGNEVVPYGASILTHCNAGALATAGYGTALGVIRCAHESGKHIHVYADETRPLLQGARLTAWELVHDNIPATLITDNMAGYAMQLGKIDMLVFGADRITLNGDVANKIGTYSISVLAQKHGIPVYTAAPLSTIDINLKDGKDIPIELRDKDEVRSVFGVQTAPKDVDAFNPAFDVTPHQYVTGIITEVGVLRPPYSISIKEAFEKLKK